MKGRRLRDSRRSCGALRSNPRPTAPEMHAKLLLGSAYGLEMQHAGISIGAIPLADPSRQELSLSAQGIVYGKPVHQGITALKPTRNLKNLAEERVGRKIGGLRILNSYWVNQVRRRIKPRRCRCMVKRCVLAVDSSSKLPMLRRQRHAGTRHVTWTMLSQDSTYKYYEVILIDPEHNAIRRVSALT